MPTGAEFDLVHDKLACSEGVKCLEDYGCSHGAHKALPHGFIRKVVGELLGAG